MAYGAKILADSLAPGGERLITFEVTVPRIVLAEFNTHRILSRNSASSRAIPVKKMIKRIMEDPYIPEAWGSNKGGMQAGENLDEGDSETAREIWLEARDYAVSAAKELGAKNGLAVHKQLTNRLLEPWMWHTIICTATEWDNLWHLRDHPMAHPAIAIPTRMMRELANSHTPKLIDYGSWHLPLVSGDEDAALPLEDQIKVCVGRCARVSYLTHPVVDDDGTVLEESKRDVKADIALHNRLLQSGHMSPLEHAARPMSPVERDHFESIESTLDISVDLHGGRFVQRGGVAPTYFWGNFNGWVQYRKLIPGEHDLVKDTKI